MRGPLPLSQTEGGVAVRRSMSMTALDMEEQGGRGRGYALPLTGNACEGQHGRG